VENESSDWVITLVIESGSVSSGAGEERMVVVLGDNGAEYPIEGQYGVGSTNWHGNDAIH